MTDLARGAASVTDLDAEPPELSAFTERPGPRPVRPDAVLRVEGLRVAFPGVSDTLAVDDVSFSVERGEVLALVGESGSGKSVTAQAVLGLLPGTARASGSVQLTADPSAAPAPAQQNLLGAPEPAWRGVRGRVAALVFQEPQTALNPVRTVGWQLAEAVRAHQRVSRSVARLRAVELLRTVGVTEPERRAEAYPHQLSGGQKQRVVIALALTNNPALLIADEPTTALDVTVQAEILQLLGELRARLGTAVLLITHNMGVVADLADRVLVMRRGRMVERGEVVSLFAAPYTDYARALLAAVPRLPAPAAAHAALAAVTPVAVSQTGRQPRPALEVVDLAVEYPGRGRTAGFQALADVNLQLAPGKVLGVVGESGSGKTTLARAVSGQLAASAGSIHIDGVDLARVAAAELRRMRGRLGVVHQDPATTLDPLVSVGDSVAEPLLLHRAARGATLRAQVRALLDEVALPAGTEHRQPHELSGGQRQRVALARALALRPALLLADEPTSALDVTVQAGILQLFAELQAELGFACVFISHDLAVVHQVSDDVLVLRAGRVVEQGPTPQVLTRPTADYTRRLLNSVPVPDPVEQRVRRGGTEHGG